MCPPPLSMAFISFCFPRTFLPVLVSPCDEYLACLAPLRPSLRLCTPSYGVWSLTQVRLLSCCRHYLSWLDAVGRDCRWTLPPQYLTTQLESIVQVCPLWLLPAPLEMSDPLLCLRSCPSLHLTRTCRHIFSVAPFRPAHFPPTQCALGCLDVRIAPLPESVTQTAMGVITACSLMSGVTRSALFTVPSFLSLLSSPSRTLALLSLPCQVCRACAVSPSLSTFIICVYLFVVPVGLDALSYHYCSHGSYFLSHFHLISPPPCPSPLCSLQACQPCSPFCSSPSSTRPPLPPLPLPSPRAWIEMCVQPRV